MRNRTYEIFRLIKLTEENGSFDKKAFIKIASARFLNYYESSSCDGRKCTSVLKNVPENTLGDTTTVLKS